MQQKPKIYKKAELYVFCKRKYKDEEEKLLPDGVFKKGALESFVKLNGKHLCGSLFLEVCYFNEKKTSARVFSFKFCEIVKNIYFVEHLRTAASTGIFCAA